MSTERKIAEVLKKHPYGLTIEDISRILDINRATASKYLLVLAAESKVSVRIVGKAKLHYPRSVKL